MKEKEGGFQMESSVCKHSSEGGFEQRSSSVWLDLKSRGDDDKGKCEKKQIVQGLVGIWTLARGQLVTLECVNQGSESRLAFQKGGSAALLQDDHSNIVQGGHLEVGSGFLPEIHGSFPRLY